MFIDSYGMTSGAFMRRGMFPDYYHACIRD